SSSIATNLDNLFDLESTPVRHLPRKKGKTARYCTHGPEIAAQGHAYTGLPTEDAQRLTVDTNRVHVSIQHYPVSTLFKQRIILSASSALESPRERDV